jgi:hypothetical protein
MILKAIVDTQFKLMQFLNNFYITVQILVDYIYLLDLIISLFTALLIIVIEMLPFKFWIPSSKLALAYN